LLPHPADGGTQTAEAFALVHSGVQMFPPLFGNGVQSRPDAQLLFVVQPEQK
jgi:hypothetical protein